MADTRFYEDTQDSYPDEVDKIFYEVSDNQNNYTSAFKDCKWLGHHKGRLAILKTRREYEHAKVLQTLLGKLHIFLIPFFNTFAYN